jgi:CDP-glucose 4,6-dehydratase
VENLGMTGPRLPSSAFWAHRRVLVTGHTGFKGSWLSLWLQMMKAQVAGFALPPETQPAHFLQARVAEGMKSQFGDLRDSAAIEAMVVQFRPEIVLHFGAQALVRQSYRDPAGTFATNVQGSVNLLEAIAKAGSTEAILVITSDKVYANDESGRAFDEADPLGGHDPYSLSKAATEHVVDAFRVSRFAGTDTRLMTLRGGNVIGGGDYSADRIVPDIVRAAVTGQLLSLRQPGATRPWQHVLDCLLGYLVAAECLMEGLAPKALNIGPDPGIPISVSDIADALLTALRARQGWRRETAQGEAMREMHKLALNPAKARSLGIADFLPGRAALDWTANWYRQSMQGGDIRELTQAEIARYRSLIAPSTKAS